MQPLTQVISPAIISRERATQNNTKQAMGLFDQINQIKLDIIDKGSITCLSECIRPEVAESWVRSRNYGVNQYQLQYPMLGKSEFNKFVMKKQNLIKAAEPYLSQLDSILTCTSCYAMLTDEQGVVLHLIFRNDAISEYYHIGTGCVVNEETIGTCSHALSILYKVPYQMWGPEHYCQSLYRTTGSSAPVFDSLGNLAGTLTIVSDEDYRQNVHTLGLVLSMAWVIQDQFQLTSHNELLNSILEFEDHGLITVNNSSVITEANVKAQKLFDLPKLKGKPMEAVLGDQPLIRNVLHSGRPIDDAEMQIIKDSVPKVYQCSIYPIKDSLENIYGCILRFKISNRAQRLIQPAKGKDAQYTFKEIIASCDVMKKSLVQAKHMANSDVNILIQGESGTGKDIFAQAIHNSSRSAGPFVAVNCAAIPRSLIESELFGYEGGAFTGAERGGKRGKIELANGGTLFLDEIGDMPLEVQPVLLRVLEEKKVMRLGSNQYIPVDFRLITATNQNLLDLVNKSLFRQDLYYRLSVFRINIPPLRERNEDIIQLAQHFIHSAAQRLKIKEPVLSDPVKLLILQYLWPGNVRQLENAMLYAVHLCKGGVIWPEDLPDDIHLHSADIFQKKSYETKPIMPNSKMNLQIKEIEIISIKQALQNTGNNIRETAEILGLSKSTLYRKIREYKLMDV
ncbi:sigma-54-dependent Fis family transcriptional regulator [Candidatus Formimonas warabiya]|uniref:Sigma-54 factor interaction domain-containing protein n=1 Tax=Formimonas warabiya TaxID=1761012 RepID=A0A3G1KMJ6_FORW1|nr:sigma 54-interacting transcriptional regulator [Candidatus Formimonas warabiya]ATW23649.1 hypothetical protein DCMF_01490 [Candidatus Formimonas warabiya]